MTVCFPTRGTESEAHVVGGCFQGWVFLKISSAHRQYSPHAFRFEFGIVDFQGRIPVDVVRFSKVLEIMFLIVWQVLLLIQMIYFISNPACSKVADALYTSSRPSTLSRHR